MLPFVFHNPTKLIFGEGQLAKLPGELAEYSNSRVLLVYGGGSIKRNGLYDQVVAKLKEAGFAWSELSGVEPNPRLSTVNRGIEICKQDEIGFILAVGGGSVIDCAKAIAVGARFEGNVWDIMERKAAAKDALPLGTILTLAATGSEMNNGSVITNEQTLEKLGWGSPLASPKFSILDPAYTVSVPRDQTVYGIVDIMSHIFESYFHKTTPSPIQDGWAETLLRTVIDTAPKLLEQLDNLEARGTILLSGTLALNGTISMGTRGDWATHNIEHAVSAVYDIPHGGGLAILFPNWMTYGLNDHVDRFKQMAVNVFGVNPAGKSDRAVAEEGIAALRTFWSSIGAPARLADYDIDDSQLEVMADKAMKFGPFGNFKRLEKDDVLAIYKMSL